MIKKRAGEERHIRTLAVFTAAAFLLAFSGEASAYRPLQTEDAYVAGKGVVQSELSYDHLKWKNGDEDNVILLVPIIGLTETLELSVQIPYIYHKPKDGKTVHGFGDISLVAKQVVIKEGEKFPQITAEGVVKLDNGDSGRGLGTGGVDYTLSIAVTKGLGPFTLSAQAGYTWVGNKADGTLTNIALWGLAADYAVTDKFHTMAEIYGNRNPDRRLPDLDNVLAGVYYNLTDKLTVDASLRTGLSDASLNWAAGAGLAYQFN
jgi:outer membrane putative beta-barrel porin/alpha-amylase